jgi:hypothetical protein
MTQLMLQLAATHDPWSQEPAIRHVGAIVGWGRHFSRSHPVLPEIAEWSGAALIAVALVAAELVASA